MELFKALGVLAEPPEAEHARLIELLGLPAAPDSAAYHDLFLLQLYPYASVYLGAEGMMGGEARDRVAGFWRALRRSPPPEPDHLCSLMALYSSLAEGPPEAEDAVRALVDRARAALLHEHLTSWLFPFLDKARQLGGPFYGAWAALLEEALVEEIRACQPPDGLPLHLREAPGLPDPRTEGGEAFLAGLLAPVRCGMIVTRGDLVSAGRRFGLGLRIGERAYVLKAFFAQDAEAVLRWLADEAESWVNAHEARVADLGEVARFWAERAQATAHLAGELLEDRSGWADPEFSAAAGARAGAAGRPGSITER